MRIVTGIRTLSRIVEAPVGCRSCFAGHSIIGIGAYGPGARFARVSVEGLLSICSTGFGRFTSLGLTCCPVARLTRHRLAMLAVPGHRQQERPSFV